MNRIYLDFNASAPIDAQVLKVFIQELQSPEGNPSSIHSHGKRCRRVLEESRKRIADFFRVKSNEVIFTSGGTEGASMFIQGIQHLNPGRHMISSSLEHACVFQPLKELEKAGTPVSFLPADERGAVCSTDVEQAIRPDTCLIILMAVNNETGVMTDIEAIAQIAQTHQIPLIIDGVAWLGKEKLTIPKGVSGIFFSGHKIYAPKGIGFCIARSSLKLSPLLLGGGHEYYRRAGTENLPGIVALAEAVSLFENNQEQEIGHIRHLRSLLETHLCSRLSNVIVNGSGPRSSNTSNLAFLGVDGETLLMNLDLEGISVSHGSACSSGSLEPSRILIEMGLPLHRVNSSIRFSLGRSTTQEEIERAIEIIIKIVKRLQA